MMMSMMTRRPLHTLFLLTTTLALLTPTALDAQRGGGGRGGGAQATAGPATVEFVATTADGQLATDLTADQITLRVGNRDRVVSSLELVRFGGTGTPASALPAPFGTNSITDGGRTFMIIVDEESLRPGLEDVVRNAVTELEQTLSPADRLALFTIPRGTTSLSPTTDRAAFAAALARIQGRQKATMTASDRRCHTRDTLNSVESLLQAAATPSGVTPVLFFTTGMVGAAAGSASGGATDCTVQPNDFQKMGPAADQARAQLYVLRAEQTTDRTTSEGLENLTGVTGGQLMYVSGTEGGAMNRVIAETSAYYIATFQADANERTGGSARLDLRTTRTDVTLRTRATVAIPRGAAAVTPESMLRELTVHRQFGLRVVGIPSRHEGDAANSMKVFALAQPVDPAVKLSAAAAALYDPLGKLIAQWTARPEELQRPVVAAAIPVPPGSYRLRMAAVDTSGRAATADYELNVTTASAGPADLGGLMMGAVSNGSFMPIITVTDQKEIVAVFELYGRPGGGFGAIVEILSDINSPAIVDAPPQPSATQIEDKFMFMATLPVADLKPGDYILRAQLAFEGQPTGTLTRTIRKQ